MEKACNKEKKIPIKDLLENPSLVWEKKSKQIEKTPTCIIRYMFLSNFYFTFFLFSVNFAFVSSQTFTFGIQI